RARAARVQRPLTDREPHVVAIAAHDHALDHVIVDDGVRLHAAIAPVRLAARVRHPAGHIAELAFGAHDGEPARHERAQCSDSPPARPLAISPGICPRMSFRCYSGSWLDLALVLPSFASEWPSHACARARVRAFSGTCARKLV